MKRLLRWLAWWCMLCAATWAGSAATRFEAFGINDPLGWARCCWALVDVLLAAASAHLHASTKAS